MWNDIQDAWWGDINPREGRHVYVLTSLKRIGQILLLMAAFGIIITAFVLLGELLHVG